MRQWPAAHLTHYVFKFNTTFITGPQRRHLQKTKICENKPTWFCFPWCMSIFRKWHSHWFPSILVLFDFLRYIFWKNCECCKKGKFTGAYHSYPGMMQTVIVFSKQVTLDKDFVYTLLFHARHFSLFFFKMAGNNANTVAVLFTKTGQACDFPALNTKMQGWSNSWNYTISSNLLQGWSNS